jgi:capsular polysaccharide biosynthesis protein
VTWSAVGLGEDLPERIWGETDYTTTETKSGGDPSAGLATVGFFTAALGRRRRLWLSTAGIGLLIGCGMFIHAPAPYQAATTVLLKDGPSQDPQYQINTDLALAQGSTVAENAIHQLGLQLTPSTFLHDYAVTAPTNSVLVITATAPTSSEAVQWASAVASQFLQFRAQYAQTQQQQLEASLNEQLSKAEQNLSAITSQVIQEEAQPSTPDKKATLATLKAKELTASNALSNVQTSVTGTLLSTRAATATEVQSTQVINVATPLKHSRTRAALLYVGGFSVGGLGLGVAIVVIGALVSNKLRRREDVAYAIGAPVRLSVGPLKPGRLSRLPWQAKASKARDHDMKRLVAHLRDLAGDSGTPASLAVVALDDTETAARAVVSLALSNSSEGKRVLLADLSRGRHAAHLMKKPEPGTHKVNAQGIAIMLQVPGPDDAGPVGPLRNGKSPDGRAQAGTMAAMGAQADMVISLVTLDPSAGAEYLATWATDAVALVTAGQSSAEAIRAAGEMIRLAGTRLGSVVLIGADENDESLGMSSLDPVPA